LPVKNNIKILNNVPDLKDVYESIDLLVFPIFSGSGMKVKTAEALMYGKYIIGTAEAFEGYDITDKCGIVCKTPKDFITAIETIKVSKFNIESRRLFEHKYSFESTLKLFEKHLL
jgi:glycosyltransferase involved in cell wall biosynthesis